MWQLLIIAARSQDSENEWLYILVVLGFILISAIVEKVKKLISDERERRDRPSRPRPPVSPMPRPRIPQVPEVPTRRAEQPERPLPPRRPVAPPRPVTQYEPAEPKKVIIRTPEERKSVLRGEPAPSLYEKYKTESAAPRQPALASALKAAETAAEAARTIGRVTTRLQPLHKVETTHVAENVTARSFRKLTPSDLRRAVVLKEILDPPLGLRD